MDEQQQTNGTPAGLLHYEKVIDQYAAIIAPDAAMDLAKWGSWGGGATGIFATNNAFYRTLPQSVAELKTNYMPARRNFVFNQRMGLGAEFPDAQPTNVVISIGAIDFNPASTNQAEEYIRLINTNQIAVDISGWKLSGGVEHTFQGGVVIPRSNSVYVVPDKKAFRNRSTVPRGGMGLYIEGPYKGQLSARGETLVLTDTRSRVVATNTYVGAPSGAQQYLRITELMYHPPFPGAGSPYLQEEFEFIELQNIGPVAINLTGVHFTNGIEFVFSSANRTNLNAGETLILAKNVPAFRFRYPAVPQGGITGPYLGSLANDGETIRLDDAVGEKILEFTYNPSWYRMTDGNGFSLVITNATNTLWSTWGDQSSWRSSSAFNGSPGATDPPPSVFPSILVNEVFAHSVPLDVDAIELYNPTANAVDVGNWWISDDFLTPRKYRIPASTVIPARGYRVFTESDFNNPPSAPNSFAFGAADDEAYVFSGDATGNITGYFDGFGFGASEPGVSFGRYFTSETNLHYVAQKALSLGATNAGPKVGPIVISEIMYHPPDIAAIDNNAEEFIELQNISSNAVPLFDSAYPTNRWQLDDAVHFDFSTNTIPAGGFLVVVSFDPTNTAMLAAFRATYRIGANVPIVGPYTGQLDNSDESVELKKPDTSVPTNVTTVLVERVHYHDVPPWDSFADGFAASLQRIVVRDYGNDPTNWVATFPNPGAAFIGGTRPAITSHPTNTAGVVRQGTNSFTVVATGPGLQYQWRANGTNLPGATNATLVLANVEATQAGAYQVIVFNGAGGVFSSNAYLSVLFPVAFTLQPQNQLPLPGSTATISALAVGNGTIRYQWYFGGTAIPNATNASYTFTNASIPTHHGIFSVVATDDVSTAVSSNALIFIRIPPVVVVQPVSVTNLQWQTATFSVVATGAPPLSYRWLRQGINFLSNAPPTLVLTNLQPGLAGSFRVTVTNQAGNVNSTTVNLGVIADTDADGLPDFWETNYVGNATNMSGTADPDGDGMINRDEYVAGTDPTNALSVLKLTLTTTNTGLLQFVAQANIGYTLQYRTNLSSAVWSNLTSISAQSLMQTIQVNVPKPPPEPARFYRIITPPAP